MTKDQRIDAAVALLVERGVKKNHAYPMGQRTLRKFGLPLRPPAFSSFKALAWSNGMFFTVGWGGFMLILQPQLDKTLLFTAPLAGLFFGIVMAAFSRKKFRDLNLPAWDDIETSGV